MLILAVCPAVCGQRLNDTGITYGGDYPKGTNSDCVAIITDRADDETLNALFVAQQDCANGENQLRYVKIGADGERLGSGAARWACVHDETTGLMWEVKQSTSDSHLHHFADQYTWYNSSPQHNGNAIGDWNRNGDHCHGYDPASPRSFCHVEQFARRVNRAGLCGYADWRVPTRRELASLVHFGRSQPSIDKPYFPHTQNTFYWALNPVAGRPLEAWAINFEFGNTSPLRKTDPRPARLVRTVRPAAP